MHATVQLNGIFVALAVLLFVSFAVAILVIIDHKAKIPSGVKHDPFSISGIRHNHPIWAWGVSVILWIIIGSLLASIFYRMAGGHLPEKEQDSSLLASLNQDHQDEKLRHFHNTPPSTPYSDGVQPICYACHGEFPHSAKPMVRTLLNMHTQFIGCMTCHADAKKIPEEQLQLRWLNYSGIPTEGRPFGLDLNPDTGALMPTDDYYSKIVPYQVDRDGSEQLLEITEEHNDAREFLAVRGQLTGQQQGAVKKLFHNIVNPVGRFCTRCHTEEGKSLIPFRKLGFSDQRVTALTNLNIVGIVQKYKEFYIPSIFYNGESQTEQKVLVGEDVQVPEPSDEMKQDPRAWWRKAYGETPAPAVE